MPARTLDLSRLRRILVCRLNHRLGNTLLLTPFLRSLGASVPACRVEVLLGQPAFAPLLEGLPEVEEVHAFPRRLLRQPRELLRRCRELRARSYDLAVDPALGSRSNGLVLWLCRTRFRLGFRRPGRWPRLTHGVRPRPEVPHEALRPLELLEATVPAERLRLHPSLDVGLGPEERRQGRRALLQLLGAAAPRRVLGFFPQATGDKRLPREWWNAWLDELVRLDPELKVVELLSPDGAGGPRPGVPALREPSLRRLAALLSAMDGFASGDTGPMHLASAAGVATLGFFRASEPSRYGPLGPRGLSLRVGGLSLEDVARRVLLHLARDDGRAPRERLEPVF